MQEVNGKEPFHSIMVQYFDKLQKRMHVLGPSVDAPGDKTVGNELVEVLHGLNFAAQQCPDAVLLRPRGQVCRGILVRLCELVADMDDSHFTKAMRHLADLNWIPGVYPCRYTVCANCSASCWMFLVRGYSQS